MIKYQIHEPLAICMEKDQSKTNSPLGRLLAEVSEVKFDLKPGNTYDLFFTTKGIIAALIYRVGDTAAAAAMLPIGIIGGLYGRSPRWPYDDIATKLAKKGPEAILQDNNSNFIILYSDIKSIIIRKGGTFFNQELMLFFDDNTEYKFTYPKQPVDKSPQILKELLGDKVSII